MEGLIQRAQCFNSSKKKVVRLDAGDADAASEERAAENLRGWTGWRGANRDGLVPRLPERLAAEPEVLWQIPMTGDSLAGVAATDELVIACDRNQADTQDVYRCLDAETGLELWAVEQQAIGELDYGNSPRATPLIDGERVYLMGALGHLLAVDLASGDVLWQRDLPAEFGGEVPIWGFTASPLIADGRLIVTTGATKAFLAALDPETGETLWTTPGRRPAYASFISANVRGSEQLIGYDETTLGGWDVRTGDRLWELVPPEPDDFNVPTPIFLKDEANAESSGGGREGPRLLVTTENNGTRLYPFDNDGRLEPSPIAQHGGLSADSSTAVVTAGGRAFGVWGSLYCLDLHDQLQAVWKDNAPVFRDYASLVADAYRVLVTTTSGSLRLYDGRADEPRLLGEQVVVNDEAEVHAHPAIVGSRCYLRSTTHLYCVDFRDLENQPDSLEVNSLFD